MSCIRYDTVKFKCRYVKLPVGYSLTSLSWGSGSCFFVASVQFMVREETRSGVLIYRFNHWHPGWHLDRLQSPYFLLHTGLHLPNYTEANRLRTEARERQSEVDRDALGDR